MIYKRISGWHIYHEENYDHAYAMAKVLLSDGQATVLMVYIFGTTFNVGKKYLFSPEKFKYEMSYYKKHFKYDGLLSASILNRYKLSYYVTLDVLSEIDRNITTYKQVNQSSHFILLD